MKSSGRDKMEGKFHELKGKVRELAGELPDQRIAEELGRQGCSSAMGKPFTVSMIKWIRFRHGIAAPDLKRPGELTVQQVAEKFAVSANVVYYWLEREMFPARRINGGSPWWITLDSQKEQELREKVRNSTKIQALCAGYSKTEL